MPALELDDVVDERSLTALVARLGGDAVAARGDGAVTARGDHAVSASA